MAEMEENDEYISVLRHQNRVQRSVNKQLRRALKLHKEKADSNFIEICETKTEEQLAVEKLWTFGGFNGPLDLDVLVDTCLELLQTK
jgi:hypothetical protein